MNIIKKIGEGGGGYNVKKFNAKVFRLFQDIWKCSPICNIGIIKWVLNRIPDIKSIQIELLRNVEK